MKTVSLLFIASLTAALVSCKKEIPVSNSLTGTWELSQDGGGWTPIIQHKPGNDTLAIFTETTYAFYDRNKLAKSGTYTVRKDSSYLYRRLANRIIFDGNTDLTHEFFDIQNNQVSFWLDAYDAGSATYRRIK